MAALRSGFRRLFSISAFSPPPRAAVPSPAEPSTNLFVSGLSKRTTSEGLREAFSKFGQVVYGYATLEEAAEGIKGMDGKFLDGWVIFAEYARPRPPPSGQARTPTSPPQTSEPPFNHQ
ncbi:organelle RRM domain-containing protein 2, mitochondrial-like isoform X2 [Zingiber officinale]|uniref:organelle RRM domain-containing protein 2, mitochondrial-like isoform X2 n=1 Tax=Zingiber officinale TaxID=94328 RepID=UPI001C4D27E7|nr:organelle RRM domain-containing protein 2, mitochondrial-like isoform X2 [Zingiber officinale]